MSSYKNKFKLLSPSDYERLVKLSEQIHETNSNEPFLNHLYSILKTAIPNKFFAIDYYSANPIFLRQVTTLTVPEEQLEVYRRYMKQHPLLKHLLSIGKTGVYTILSETTAEKFHQTDLYRKFYKDIGVEDQLIFRLFHIKGAYVIAYSRDTAFSEKERVFIELLKPQVAIALKNWRRIRDLEKDLRTLQQPPSENEPPLEADVDEKTLIDSLTPRQMEIAELIAQGMNNKQIAGVLQIAPKTVGKHIENIFETLKIHNRSTLVALWQNEKPKQAMYNDLQEP